MEGGGSNVREARPHPVAGGPARSPLPRISACVLRPVVPPGARRAPQASERTGFDAAVAVTGAPTLQLSNGGMAEFTGIESDDEGAGNDAVLTLPAAGTAGSLSASNNIVIKTNALTAPVVVAVQSSTPFGTTFGAGATVPITVTFSEPVTVTGTPQLALAGGGFAMYTRGSGSRVLSFVYAVGAGQTVLVQVVIDRAVTVTAAAALNYLTRRSLELNGATIKDAVNGRDADLTLPPLGLAG